ncbi:methyltransferase domain-containing protein, partial [Pseudomonas stutzeri]|nr:methyltransferase domain-containing protein [Stutzerimonas stutzeri]
MDFNTSKDSYRDTVEDVLSFAGQGLDFYTRAKADAFARILRRDGMTAPRVLDIGCGHGFIHPLLAQQGCEVVGVEMAA